MCSDRRVQQAHTPDYVVVRREGDEPFVLDLSRLPGHTLGERVQLFELMDQPSSWLQPIAPTGELVVLENGAVAEVWVDPTREGGSEVDLMDLPDLPR